MYLIEKNITRFYQLGYTYFLNPREIQEVKKELKKEEYQIYSPYPDSEKQILYHKKIPTILLYEIKSKIPMRHQDILGTMYSLNIAEDLFGDILVMNNHYYIYILPLIQNYIETNLLRVKNSHIELEEKSLETLENYEREYEKIELIVSSNRIDTIISAISHTGRNNISEKIKKKEILLNYDYLKNPSYKLKEKDTFSIKKIGKFKYNGILKTTKGNHFIIEILKYK